MLFVAPGKYGRLLADYVNVNVLIILSSIALVNEAIRIKRMTNEQTG